MSREAVVQKQSWIAVMQRFTCALFRTNSGKAYLSNSGPAGVTWHNDGSITIESPRPVALGLALMQGQTVDGLSDLNGYTTVTVTPEWAARMMGKKVAVFTSLEMKKLDGRKQANQRQWLKNVSEAGGIAGFARSPEEAIAIIETWIESGRPPAL